MAADFDKPTLDDEYTSILPQGRDNNNALAVMFNNIQVFNIPVNAVQFANGQFNLWDGANWNVQPVSISGGGTGATNQAGARSNLGVLSESESDSRYMQSSNNLSDLDNISQSRTELNVYSKQESLAVANNLSDVQSAAVSFDNIKQSASASFAGVSRVRGFLNETSSLDACSIGAATSIWRSRCNFKADFNGSSFSVQDFTGSVSYWGLQNNSSIQKIATGQIRISLAGTGISPADCTILVTAIDSNPYVCTVSNITSTTFDIFTYNLSSSSSDQDLFIQIAKGFQTT